MTWGSWSKENLRYKFITRTAENSPSKWKDFESKPRLRQCRVGVKWKNPQSIKNTDELTDRLQEILKIPATQKHS